jgi:predicted Zn-dependent protease
MSDTDIAGRYQRALALFKAGQSEDALNAFRDIIAITDPIEETETETEMIVPFQAEPSQVEATEGLTRGGKPVRLVMDYFTAAVYQTGCVHVVLEQFVEARRFLEEAVGLWPENVVARLQLSFILVNVDEPGSAIAVLQEAQAAQPENPMIFRQLAWTHNEMGQHERALTAAERAVELDPTYIDGLEEQHFALEQLGKDEQAAAIRARVDKLTST